MSEGSFDRRAGIVLAAGATVEITSDKNHRHNEGTHSKKQVDTDVPLAGTVVVAWTLVAVKVLWWSDGRRRNLPVAITNTRSLCLFNGTVRCPSPVGVGNHVVLLRDRCHVREGICFISQCLKREQAAKISFEDNICSISACMSIDDLLSSGVVLEISHRSKERTKYACVCDTAWRVDMRRRDDLNFAGRLGTASLIQAMKHATVRRKRATSYGTERLNSVRFPR